MIGPAPSALVAWVGVINPVTPIRGTSWGAMVLHPALKASLMIVRGFVLGDVSGVAVAVCLAPLAPGSLRSGALVLVPIVVKLPALVSGLLLLA